MLVEQGQVWEAGSTLVVSTGTGWWASSWAWLEWARYSNSLFLIVSHASKSWECHPSVWPAPWGVRNIAVRWWQDTPLLDNFHDSLLKVLLLQPSLLGQFSALLATSSVFQVSVKTRLVIFNFLPAHQLTFSINWRDIVSPDSGEQEIWGPPWFEPGPCPRSWWGGCLPTSVGTKTLTVALTHYTSYEGREIFITLFRRTERNHHWLLTD